VAQFPLVLGLDTFGDVTDGPDGIPLHAAQVIRNLVEEAVLADQLGIDFIGVGEHHRADFAVSRHEVEGVRGNAGLMQDAHSLRGNEGRLLGRLRDN